MASLGVMLRITTTILLMLHWCQCQEAETNPVCIPENCQPPDCLCAGTNIPGGLATEETPQMVLFTFDDAVNNQVYAPLMDLFGMDKNRTNPNGCPVSMTLFVSHMYTNYCKVAEFYKNGHEVASHSITHRLPIQFWADAAPFEYHYETDGQRNMMVRLAGIPKEQITGYRSPFIQPGGDTQFRVLKEQKFMYDSSLLVSVNEGANRYWPYTLDFPNQVACGISPCPQKEYPGLWELPIQPIPDNNGEACTFLDRCTEATTAEDVYGYLMRSFNTSFHRNRAPLILNMHAYWFESNDHSLEGFGRFIEDIIKMEETYIITSSQLVEWMRKPTSLAQRPKSELWKCDKKTTGPCSNIAMTAGLDRSKKPDFEAYRSRKRPIYQADYAPEDGGRAVLAVTAVLFGVCFIYLVYNEPV